MAISADVMAAKPSEGEASSDRSRSNALTFEEVYAQGFPHVVRWIRAFGGLDADLDDLAQEIFVVVRRQLPKFDGTNLAGWLYRITQRTVKDYREGAWYRRALGKRDDDKRALRASIAPQPDPSEVLERRDAIRVLTQLLAQISEAHRTAFILFEIEGYTGEEIAQLEDVPLNTVWTRLHHARKELYMLIDQARTQGRLP
ncbi:MAG TPA: RNA polymerase sigma factor [Polyangiaceae bacterium]|jgi:RNA polymerase sigma-70 factor (ECF subfamily)|nr:RNA polymerase sigma factor [Polyangiaceae bacterium]